jgi:transposase
MVEQYNPLSDSQWEGIKNFLNTERKRKIDLREVVNAIRYIVRCGIQWRALPSYYPKWKSVYYYFCKWEADGTIMRINTWVNAQDRKNTDREEKPSLILIDSQSVKLAPMIRQDRGFDANKKVNGRKRQFLVDTGGRIWDACAHAASVYDADGASLLLDPIHMAYWDERCKKVLTDTHYRGTFSVMLADEKEGKIAFEISAKLSDKPGFEVLPIRWAVERTISWTNFYRRLVKDFERTVENSAAWVIWANISLMLNRMT